MRSVVEPSSRIASWIRLVPLVVLVALVAAVTPLYTTRAQSSSDVTWETYDVAIDVREDGTMHITERQVVIFDGRFSNGFANIPLSNVESIENVSVAVAGSAAGNPEALDYLSPYQYNGNPGTFTYEKKAGELAIDYGFASTSSSFGDDHTRLIILEYDVIGGIRVYTDLEPANQQVWWYAIASDVTDIAPVNSATVTITLPKAVSANQIVAYPDNPSINGETFTWTKRDLGEGDDFEVSLQFPPITAAQVPAWQRLDDQVREERARTEERKAVAGTILLTAGLGLLFIGGMFAFITWFTKGRDPEVGKIAEYITEPPDDLRPGAAGTLVDETAQTQDLVATVLDLANRGVIRMGTQDGPGMSQQYDFELLAHSVALEPYEQALLNVIFGSGAPAGTKKPMPSIAGAFATDTDAITSGFYKELVDHQYFRESPDTVRRRWKRIYKLTPVLVVAIAVVVYLAVGELTNWIIFPLAIGLAFMFLAGRLSNAMPSKTLSGAESAAKWKAFKAYLDDIDNRLDLAESKAIFDKYLPYAVAFGLEQTWVRKFAFVATPTPQWYGGTGPLMGDGSGWAGDWNRRSRRRGGGAWTTFPGGYGGASGRGTASGGGPDFGIPDLQGTSDAAGRGLQGSSNSFFDMLGTVAKAFAESSGSGGGSFGSSRGGGFSGGGSRGGGGGGGGGSRGFR